MEINLDDVNIVTFDDVDNNPNLGTNIPNELNPSLGEPSITNETIDINTVSGMQAFVDGVVGPPVTELVIEETSNNSNGVTDDIELVNIADPYKNVDCTDIDKVANVTFEHIGRMLGLEDVSIEPSDDGFVPPDRNPQMALIPINDPTKPPSLDELRDKMNLSDVPSDSDELNNADVGEILASNTAISGLLASTGFDLTMATEQFSGDADLLTDAEIDALEKLNIAIRDRQDELEEVRTVLIEQKGLDSDTAKRIESFDKGLISSRVSLETISRFPSKHGYTEALESVEHAIVIAKAAGAVAIFALLVKIILHIKKVLTARGSVSEKDRAAVRTLQQKLVVELGRIDKDYSGELKTNDKLAEKFDALMKKHKLPVRLGQKPFLQINEGVMSSYIRANLENKYNSMIDKMITGDSAQRMTRTLIDGINSAMPLVNSRFVELENKFKTNDTLDPASFKVDLPFVLQLEKIAGITSNSDVIAEKVIYLKDGINKLLNSGQNTAAIPTYQKLIEFKYDIDSAYEFNDKYDKELRKLLNSTDKLRKESGSLTDAAMAKNREECASVLKTSVQSLLSLTIMLVQIRDCANTIVKTLRSASVKSTDDWTKLFAGTGITFKVS